MSSSHTIATAICVDTDASGRNSGYPNIGGKRQQGMVYWDLAACSMATSYRFNPNAKHIVFTNSLKSSSSMTTKARSIFEALPINIVEIPFRRFDPGQRARRFRNAFFKMEAILALGGYCGSSILLDADCIWSASDKGILGALRRGGTLLLQDTYQRSAKPMDRSPHATSMADFGELFRKLDPDYPSRFPVWYGGEIIGGSSSVFQLTSGKLKSAFRLSLELAEQGCDLRFPNGSTIFDNDEYLGSFVYNKLPVTIVDSMNVFSRRVWNWHGTESLDVPILHMAGEKNGRLPRLLNAISSMKSDFWHSSEPRSFLAKALR